MKISKKMLKKRNKEDVKAEEQRRCQRRGTKKMSKKRNKEDVKAEEQRRCQRRA